MLNINFFLVNLYKIYFLIYFMNELNNYIEINENQNTLLTIYIYNKLPAEILPVLEREMDKGKCIQNPAKKNKICNRYFNLIKKIKEINSEVKISSIYLVGNDIIEYKLKLNEINVIKEYKLKEIYYVNDYYFKINYLKDLFYNFDFIFTIYTNKNSCTIIKLNETKRKELNNFKVSSENDVLDKINFCREEHKYKNLIIIYGISNYINKIKDTNDYIVKNDNLDRIQLYDIYSKFIYKTNMILLEKKLNELNNPNTNTDLFIFGRLKIEIKEAIESYMIKELYIEERKIELLKKCIDSDCFNFKIIPIKSVENSDIADKFIKDYKGLMGIKYY